MSSTREQLAQSTPSNTTAATIYTVPGATTAIAIVVKVANVTATAATCRVFHPPSGSSYAAGNAILYDVTIDPGETRSVLIPAATAAQNIGIRTGTADALTFTAYGVEYVTGSGPLTLTALTVTPGLVDFGDATLEIPHSAAPTVNAAGMLAMDTTIADHTGALTYHDGVEALYALAMPTANLTATDGYGVHYNAANNEFEMGAPWAWKTAKVVTTGDNHGDYICDGTADEVQIQAAIDAVNAAGGGVVELKAGTYAIADTIDIKSKVWIRGQGPICTILKLDNSAGVEVLSGSSVTDFQVSQIAVDGNKANNTADYYNILIEDCTTGILDVVHSYNGHRFSTKGDGIYVTNTTEIVLDRCQVYDNEGVGMKLTNAGGATKYSIISNCISHDNGSDSIVAWRVEYCAINGCISYDGLEDGITLHGAETDATTGPKFSSLTNCVAYNHSEDGIVFCTSGDSCVISGNTSHSNGEDGLNVYWQGNYCIITGNTTRNNTRTGIRVQGSNDDLNPSDYCIISSNTAIDNDSGDSNTYSGITVQFACSNCLIANNICKGALQNYGINIQHSTCENNLVIGNICMDADNRVAGIKDNGTNTSLVFNITGDGVCDTSIPAGEFKTGGTLITTPDEITATSAGVAASIATVTTEVTTNGDSDLDNVTLANGTSGQVKHIYCVVEGNAADTWKITPATMCGGTQITFAGVGEGCTLVYADNEGWVVTGNNGGTIT